MKRGWTRRCKASPFRQNNSPFEKKGKKGKKSLRRATHCSRNAAAQLQVHAARACKEESWPAQRQSAYLTSKPSLRRHALCASICAAQASSPNITTHSSRGLRVSAEGRGGEDADARARWRKRRRAARGCRRPQRPQPQHARTRGANERSCAAQRQTREPSAPGHAQQIFLPLLPTGGAGGADAPAVDGAADAAAAELICPTGAGKCVFRQIKRKATQTRERAAAMANEN